MAKLKTTEHRDYVQAIAAEPSLLSTASKPLSSFRGSYKSEAFDSDGDTLSPLTALAPRGLGLRGTKRSSSRASSASPSLQTRNVNLTGVKRKTVDLVNRSLKRVHLGGRSGYRDSDSDWQPSSERESETPPTEKRSLDSWSDYSSSPVDMQRYRRVSPSLNPSESPKPDHEEE